MPSVYSIVSLSLDVRERDMVAPVLRARMYRPPEEKSEKRRKRGKRCRAKVPGTGKVLTANRELAGRIAKMCCGHSTATGFSSPVPLGRAWQSDFAGRRAVAVGRRTDPRQHRGCYCCRIGLRVTEDPVTPPHTAVATAAVASATATGIAAAAAISAVTASLLLPPRAVGTSSHLSESTHRANLRFSEILKEVKTVDTDGNCEVDDESEAMELLKYLQERRARERKEKVRPSTAPPSLRPAMGKGDAAPLQPRQKKHLLSLSPRADKKESHAFPPSSSPPPPPPSLPPPPERSSVSPPSSPPRSNVRTPTVLHLRASLSPNLEPQKPTKEEKLLAVATLNGLSRLEQLKGAAKRLSKLATAAKGWSRAVTEGAVKWGEGQAPCTPAGNSLLCSPEDAGLRTPSPASDVLRLSQRQEDVARRREMLYTEFESSRASKEEAISKKMASAAESKRRIALSKQATLQKMWLRTLVLGASGNIFSSQARSVLRVRRLAAERVEALEKLKHLFHPVVLRKKAKRDAARGVLRGFVRLYLRRKALKRFTECSAVIRAYLSDIARVQRIKAAVLRFTQKARIVQRAVRNLLAKRRAQRELMALHFDSCEQLVSGKRAATKRRSSVVIYCTATVKRKVLSRVMVQRSKEHAAALLAWQEQLKQMQKQHRIAIASRFLHNEDAPLKEEQVPERPTCPLLLPHKEMIRVAVDARLACGLPVLPEYLEDAIPH